MPSASHNGIDVHFREAGSGPPAVLLHSGGSTAGQWRALMERFAPAHHVIAPEFYGHGRTPPWPGDGAYWLDDEAALVEAVMPPDEPAHLIAHSYGASVALHVVKRGKRPVATLTLIEVTLFGLLRGTDEEAWQSMLNGGARLIDMVEAGDAPGGARRFMDYLFGEGTFAAMPEERQQALVAAMPAIANATRAQIAPGVEAAAYAGIETPALMIYGSETPRDIRRTCEILGETLPKVRVEIVPGASHWVPMTHADTVNAMIEDFIGSVV